MFIFQSSFYHFFKEVLLYPYFNRDLRWLYYLLFFIQYNYSSLKTSISKCTERDTLGFKSMVYLRVRNVISTEHLDNRRAWSWSLEGASSQPKERESGRIISSSRRELSRAHCSVDTFLTLCRRCQPCQPSSPRRRRYPRRAAIGAAARPSTRSAVA